MKTAARFLKPLFLGLGFCALAAAKTEIGAPADVRGTWFLSFDNDTFNGSDDPWIARVCVGLRMRFAERGMSLAFVTTSVPWTNPEGRSAQRYGRVGITFSY